MLLKLTKGILVMQENTSSGPSGNPEQKNIEDEKKKLDEDLKAGTITQAEHFKKMQKLTSGSQNVPPSAPPPTTPAPAPAGPPQLPPVGGGPMQPGPVPVKSVGPVSPISPVQPGPKEEVPPIGQALAVGSEDIEVVECYKCGGLITITTKQRPVIIACPSCGTKGEVDTEELAPAPEEPSAPKPTDAKPLEEDKLFKFSSDDHAEMPQSPQPTFGATLDDDLAKQDSKKPSQPAAAPTAPTPTTGDQSPQSIKDAKKTE